MGSVHPRFMKADGDAQATIMKRSPTVNLKMTNFSRNEQCTQIIQEFDHKHNHWTWNCTLLHVTRGVPHGLRNKASELRKGAINKFVTASRDSSKETSPRDAQLHCLASTIRLVEWGAEI